MMWWNILDETVKSNIEVLDHEEWYMFHLHLFWVLIFFFLSNFSSTSNKFIATIKKDNFMIRFKKI